MKVWVLSAFLFLLPVLCVGACAGLDSSRIADRQVRYQSLQTEIVNAYEDYMAGRLTGEQLIAVIAKTNSELALEIETLKAAKGEGFWTNLGEILLALLGTTVAGGGLGAAIVRLLRGTPLKSGSGKEA